MGEPRLLHPARVPGEGISELALSPDVFVNDFLEIAAVLGETDAECDLVDLLRPVGHYIDLIVGDGLDALFRHTKHIFNPSDGLFFK
jgi:hypothetical protein